MKLKYCTISRDYVPVKMALTMKVAYNQKGGPSVVGDNVSRHSYKSDLQDYVQLLCAEYRNL